MAAAWAPPHRLADRLGRSAGEGGTRGYAAFGLAYGIATHGYTLPLFMALTGRPSPPEGGSRP